MSQPNQKDVRIKKIRDKNPKMTLEQIAKKLGYGGDQLTAGVKRVEEALAKFKPRNNDQRPD